MYKKIKIISFLWNSRSPFKLYLSGFSSANGKHWPPEMLQLPWTVPGIIVAYINPHKQAPYFSSAAKRLAF